MPFPAIERVIKIIDLEASRGHDDRAVMGGLAQMVPSWEAEARQQHVPEATILSVKSSLEGYGDLPSEDRRSRLEALRTDLTGLPEGSAPAAPAAPSPEAPIPTEGQAEAVPKTAADGGTAPKSAGSPPRRTPTQPPPALDAPLTSIPGIGPKSAKTLSRLDLETLGDLLWFLPRRYVDYSELKTINRLWYGEEVTVLGTIDEIQVRTTRGGRMKIVEAVVSDGSGSLRVTWFNQPWIAQQLRPGEAVALSGRVDQYLGRLTMNAPEWEPLDRQQLHTSRIVPIYSLTAGVTARWMRRVMNSVVRRLAPQLPDPLPPDVLQRNDLVPVAEAIEQVHFPDSWEKLRRGQDRLAFEEMLLLQLGVMRQKREWAALKAAAYTVDETWIERFRRGLPYALTAAQNHALEDLRHDLAAGRPMNRLLQGDVGSGKTVVAAAAAGIVVAGGGQVAILAPTSILAEQHHRTLRDLLGAAGDLRPEGIRLLLGATPESEKVEIRQGLGDGSIPIVVGTHALLEEPVQFQRLALAVIDEQHRFGVEQRAALRAKGDNPHLLVMTATPIPRSLALTVFGDLDLTVLDEMPPGRQPIETRVLLPVERSRAYRFVESQIEAEHQAFFIYPLVEESEKVAARAAVEEQSRLQKEVFPGLAVGLLHGRMSGDEKETVMDAFRRGETQILVSTSVVEVGVDVPNATVMLIEGANRFGLAQLHQFRGRVGRGEHPSYCLLIPDADNETENERLRAMESTGDGFKLAEMDLEQRGPGEFLGSRQSGFADLQMARLTDVRLIERARREASRLLDADPGLELPEHAALRRTLQAFTLTEKGDIS
ncbi:MAG TPA: ATP-dependent DNA helicase RecG [Anaerolineales bacterium]|nr:ATP-dependent DNA helicase RecG [Anaerolineales bacterium]